MKKNFVKKIVAIAFASVVIAGTGIIASNTEIDHATITGYNSTRQCMDSKTDDGYYIAYGRNDCKVGDKMTSVFVHRPFSQYDDDDCLRIDWDGNRMVYCEYYPE